MRRPLAQPAARSSLLDRLLPSLPSRDVGQSPTRWVSCDLTDGIQELYVVDGGGEFYGNSICSQEEKNGWTPEGSPGPLAAQGQLDEQAAASASATAWPPGAAKAQGQAHRPRPSRTSAAESFPSSMPVLAPAWRASSGIVAAA